MTSLVLRPVSQEVAVSHWPGLAVFIESTAVLHGVNGGVHLVTDVSRHKPNPGKQAREHGKGPQGQEVHPIAFQRCGGY